MPLRLQLDWYQEEQISIYKIGKVALHWPLPWWKIISKQSNFYWIIRPIHIYLIWEGTIHATMHLTFPYSKSSFSFRTVRKWLLKTQDRLANIRIIFRTMYMKEALAYNNQNFSWVTNMKMIKLKLIHKLILLGGNLLIR